MPFPRQAAPSHQSKTVIGSSVRAMAGASALADSLGAIREDQFANATASTALSGPTTTRVRGDVWVWATVSSKEKEASCGLTMKLGTSIVCQPSANWTSETKPWSMDVSHSMLIVRNTVGATARARPAEAGAATSLIGPV
jgi:hypothetical protein